MVKLRYCVNYNGWEVDECGDLTDAQVVRLEDELPNITILLHDEDGYNEDGLYGEADTAVHYFIIGVIGDVKYEIEEDGYSTYV